MFVHTLDIMETDRQFKKDIAQLLLEKTPNSREALDLLKRKIAKKSGASCLKNSQLLKIYHELVKNKRIKASPLLETLLIKRPVRSLSGLVNVSVLTKPYPCPGKCIFCPSQKNIPKSYLKNEPAVQRAIFNKFSPFKQVSGRLKALTETGHATNKVELRIIGGTWSYYPPKYQEQFIAECFRACNNFPSLSNGSPSSVGLRKTGFRKLELKNLQRGPLCKLQKSNEKAKCRIVGMAVETRPDYITPAEIKRMRTLGVTKVELGAQTLDDAILTLNQRGHQVQHLAQATRLLKDAGFKVSYQMMPNLLGADLKKDLAVFNQLFTNDHFKPDYLKIYPVALIKNTKLYQYYQKEKYSPYNKEDLLELLTEIKKLIPCWCRVERVIRDIPSNDIVEGGARVLNLREEVMAELKKQGLACRCIRCREVKEAYDPQEKLFLFQEKYSASDGQEIFLSWENKIRGKLYAMLRLRLPEQSAEVRPLLNLTVLPVLKKAALIRDVHTFGPSTKFKQHSQGSVQHKGLGKKLIAEAEKITKNTRHYDKIAVIAAVGTRDYYRKLGYRLQNTYMVKKI